MANFRWTNKAPIMNKAENVVERAMLEIWRDARFGCPVDTGNLANSIIPSGPYVRGNTVTGDVGTNVFYAPFVEFGHGNVAPNPFMGRALEKATRKFGR